MCQLSFLFSWTFLELLCESSNHNLRLFEQNFHWTKSIILSNFCFETKVQQGFAIKTIDLLLNFCFETKVQQGFAIKTIDLLLKAWNFMLDKLNSLPCNLYNLFFMYEQFISLINICLKPIGGDIGTKLNKPQNQFRCKGPLSLNTGSHLNQQLPIGKKLVFCKKKERRKTVCIL